QDVRGSVSHVRHTDRRGCRLRIDELAYVFQLRAEAGVGGVIDQDEELKSCVLSLQRKPVRNFSAIVTLIYHHVLAVNDWNVGTVTRFHGHQDRKSTRLHSSPEWI